jgi:hypothetical protein
MTRTAFFSHSVTFGTTIVCSDPISFILLGWNKRNLGTCGSSSPTRFWFRRSAFAKQGTAGKTHQPLFVTATKDVFFSEGSFVSAESVELRHPIRKNDLMGCRRNCRELAFLLSSRASVFLCMVFASLVHNPSVNGTKGCYLAVSN